MALDANNERTILQRLGHLHSREASEQSSEHLPAAVSESGRCQLGVLPAPFVVFSQEPQDIQRRPAPIVGNADVRASAHQQHQVLDPGGNGGLVERRFASHVASVNLSPVVKEDADVRLFPAAQSDVERRLSAVVAQR